MGTKGDNNRTRIVEAADQLFYKRGYNQTSFSDIAEMTGIPRGNFYYYFKTKDDILAAVVDARVKQYQQVLQQCDSMTDDPRERLLAFADMLDSSKNSILEAGCPVGSLCSELAKDTEALQSKSREVFEIIREWMGKQFSALGYDDADDRAMDLLARMQGVSVISCAFKDNDFLQRSLDGVRTWINSLASS
jgi:AcrR family transcriptional regulator